MWQNDTKHSKTRSGKSNQNKDKNESYSIPVAFGVRTMATTETHPRWWIEKDSKEGTERRTTGIAKLK